MPQPLRVYMCCPLAIRSSGTRYCECEGLTAHNPITACSSETRYCKRDGTSVIYGCHGRPQPLHVCMCCPLEEDDEEGERYDIIHGCTLERLYACART